MSTKDTPKSSFLSSVNANTKASLFSHDKSQPVNVLVGGQNGYGPRLPQIDAATPITFNPIVPVITHMPSLFKHYEGMDKIWKALIEQYARSIDGIDFGYTLEEAAVPIGGDGQEIKVPTNARRTPVDPSISWSAEMPGNIIWEATRLWMMMYRDPDTQVSRLSAELAADNAQFDPMLMSAFSMSILFIQYDNTMRPDNIITAFFVSNMWPKETGMLGAKMEVGTSEIKERTVPFTGIVQHNAQTVKVGVQVAHMLNLHKINYDFAAPVSDSLEDSLAAAGIGREISETKETFNQDIPTGSDKALL